MLAAANDSAGVGAGADSDGGSLHISLSRPFVLKLAQIEPFMEAARAAVSGCGSFSAALQGCRLFRNDEGTRSFVSLPVAQVHPRHARLGSPDETRALCVALRGSVLCGSARARAPAHRLPMTP